MASLVTVGTFGGKATLGGASALARSASIGAADMGPRSHSFRPACRRVYRHGSLDPSHLRGPANQS
jgi:hypothetical protein